MNYYAYERNKQLESEEVERKIKEKKTKILHESTTLYYI